MRAIGDIKTGLLYFRTEIGNTRHCNNIRSTEACYCHQIYVGRFLYGLDTYKGRTFSMCIDQLML